MELEGLDRVNTVRQLEGFNEEKGGLFSILRTLAAVWAYSSTGNAGKGGGVGPGPLVNVPLFMGRAG